jgi:UDP-N-acetylglucosamine--N-acetylmuramyl-(pentapeptide) pyrophosphoryl-undecaprenol N-acetylglucosamine transferase
MVASSGGHLSELWRFWPRIQAAGVDDPLCLTFDTPQSRSLLADQRTVFLRFTASRDYRSVAANLPKVARLLRSEPFGRAFSTGSGVALSVFSLAQAMGIKCYYIESAARSVGPSVTGKVLQFVPGVETYCQSPNWASQRWRYAGSVFDEFSAAPTIESPIRRVVVMLGTIPFPFKRLVQKLRDVIPSDAQVLWQLGPKTSAEGLSGTHAPEHNHVSRPTLPPGRYAPVSLFARVCCLTCKASFVPAIKTLTCPARVRCRCLQSASPLFHCVVVSTAPRAVKGDGPKQTLPVLRLV